MRHGLVLAWVLAVVMLGSCGGESDEGAQRDKRIGSAPSRQEFIDRLDALCRAGNRKAKRLNTRAQAIIEQAPDEETALADLEPVLRQGLEAAREADRDFQRQTPPRGDEDQFHKIVQYQLESTALLTRLIEAADRRDAEAFAALIEKRRSMERTRGFFQDYGFKECGSGKSDAG